MNNVVQSFAQFLETLIGVTINQDLFISGAPSSNKVDSDIWWLISSGGNRDQDMVTGEALKSYNIDVYRRNRNHKALYDEMQDLEEKLNCDNCVQLSGYETVDVKAAVLSIDDDLDDEARKVGLLQVNLTIYKEC